MWQSEWYGRSLYDLIHPDDMEKLREQLSTNDTQPPGRILDLKSMSLCTAVVTFYYFTLTHGTQWILDLCNGIVKEGSIPEDLKSSVVLPIYKGKGDPMECGSY